MSAMQSSRQFIKCGRKPPRVCLLLEASFRWTVASAPKGRMMVPLCEEKAKQRPPFCSQFYQQKNFHLKRRKTEERNRLAPEFSILFYFFSILHLKYPSCKNPQNGYNEVMDSPEVMTGASPKYVKLRKGRRSTCFGQVFFQW